MHRLTDWSFTQGRRGHCISLPFQHTIIRFHPARMPGHEFKPASIVSLSNFTELHKKNDKLGINGAQCKSTRITPHKLFCHQNEMRCDACHGFLVKTCSVNLLLDYFRCCHTTWPHTLITIWSAMLKWTWLSEGEWSFSLWARIVCHEI